MLTAIVAMGLDNALGKNGKLPWCLPSDLQHFKTLTQGHCIIMGRKTFETLKSPLPNRKHIIITRNPLYKNEFEDVIIVNSLENGLKYAEYDSNPYIIGGGEIYTLAMPYLKKIELTRVHQNFPEADTFFPKFDFENWKLTHTEKHFKDNKNEFDYTYYTYTKNH